LGSWLIWIPQAAAALGHDVEAIPLSSPLNVLTVWAPGLAAILLAVLATGKTGVRNLVRPLRSWRVGVGWYAFALLLPAGHWAAAFGLDRLLGRTYELGPGPVPAQFGPQQAVMVPIIVVFAFPNALGEELGWRGFALPRLQSRYNALIASVVIGLFWGLWHIPAWIAQDQMAWAPQPVLLRVVSTVPAAIIFTWLYNNTGGSLLPVWLLHTSITVTGYFTPILPTHTHSTLSWALAILIIALTGPQRFTGRSAYNYRD
jgi:membrane protease YdiL (CAAX protease family)